MQRPRWPSRQRHRRFARRTRPWPPITRWRRPPAWLPSRAAATRSYAACATALALGVVHPEASGIGGGGFAVIYLAKEKKAYTLDFRERAPAAITPQAYFKDGKVSPELSKHGGLAVAVPGEVRGLSEMVRRWGKQPFARCVDGAQKLAARGFPVSWRLARNLAEIAPKASSGSQEPDANKKFTEIFASKPLPEGAIWRRPDLAWTLGKLRAGGADAFYKGEVAKEIVAAVKKAGGVLTAEDLAGYTATERAPLSTEYRGVRVYSMPPPSSGGVVLIETLGILSARDPSGAELLREGRGSSAALHVLSGLWRGCWWRHAWPRSPARSIRTSCSIR